MTSYKEPLVRISGGGRLITTSLAVSRHFEKKHKNVIRDIEVLECTEEFRGLNFEPCSYTGGNGKKLPMYNITRDGFMFLCMGFTGKAAARWKERYIMAFNALEDSLHRHGQAMPHLQAELLTARPLWQAIKRYKALGLSHAEIGKLTERAYSTVRKHVRRMEACGILTPPPELPRQQQLAFDFLPHLSLGKMPLGFEGVSDES